MRGPKNLIAEVAFGTKQLGRQTKFKNKYSKATIVYFDSRLEPKSDVLILIAPP